MLQLVIMTVLAVLGAAPAWADAPKPGDMVNNPPFANWSSFKQGTTISLKETVKLADGSTIEQFATQFGISILQNCVVMVNGQMERDRGRQLSANVKLTLIPPVAGG